MLSHHSAKFGGHGHCSSRDKKVLFCHVIPQDHVTKRMSKSMGRNLSKKVTTLPSLVAIGIAVVEI